MIRPILYSCAAAACLLGGAVLSVPFLSTQDRPAPAETEGYTTVSVDVPHRAAPIDVHIWYPTDAEAAPEVIGQTALFYGFHAQRDAAPSGRPAPVMLLSHGSGGNAAQLGWLASEMAAEGMIVIAANHQGTMSRDSDPHQTPMIWQRTRDLTAVLDALEDQRLGAFAADMSSVTALGFSLGGGAVMSLAGARLSKPGFIEYCARGEGAVDCVWMTQGGVDFNDIDAALYEADYTDPRIGRVIAVDPALSHAMTQDSLIEIDLPVTVFGLGSAGTLPLAVDAAHLVEDLPMGAHHYIDGGHHFSFLPECSPLGRIVIGLAGDDNICSDRGYAPRTRVHDRVLERLPAIVRAAAVHGS